ncbi:MAG: transposase [Polyangiales bacterium]
MIVECKGCAVFGHDRDSLAQAAGEEGPAAAPPRRRARTRAKDLLWSEYVVVFTTVPAELLSDEAILALYRLRWQVELHPNVTNRWVASVGCPARPDTIEGWVSAKLLLGAAARRMVCEVSRSRVQRARSVLAA